MSEEIPNKIGDSEKIVRLLFFPVNFKKNEENSPLKWRAYRPHTGTDEVSVIRFDYCSPEFCKKQGKKIENPDYKRNFYGFGLLIAHEIRECDCKIVYTPKVHNYHADIKIGYKIESGKQLPAEIQYKVDSLTEKTRICKDPEPTSDKWKGKDLNNFDA